MQVRAKRGWKGGIEAVFTPSFLLGKVSV